MQIINLGRAARWSRFAKWQREDDNIDSDDDGTLHVVLWHNTNAHATSPLLMHCCVAFIHMNVATRGFVNLAHMSSLLRQHTAGRIVRVYLAPMSVLVLFHTYSKMYK